MDAFANIGSEKYYLCSGKFELNNRVCMYCHWSYAIICVFWYIGAQ